MNLTPTKVVGTTLPDKTKRIGKNGHTSLIYLTDNPCELEVYTTEKVKFDWWQYGLKITDSYEEVGEAWYRGCKGDYRYNHDWIQLTLPVYRCVAKRLEMPSGEQKLHSQKLRRLVNAAHWWWLKDLRIRGIGRYYLSEFWSILAELDVPTIAEPADFITDYQSDKINPDFGPGDWGVLDGRLVCFDPFHHDDVHEAINLYTRRY